MTILFNLISRISDSSDVELCLMQNEIVAPYPSETLKNPSRHEMNNELMKVISLTEIAFFQVSQGEPDCSQLQKLLGRIRTAAHAAAKVGMEV